MTNTCLNFEPYWTIQEIANRTGLSWWRVRRAITRGDLRAIKSPGTYLIHENDATAFIETLSGGGEHSRG